MSFERLPTEIQQNILLQLTKESLIAAKLVNKNWKKIVKEEIFEKKDIVMKTVNRRFKRNESLETEEKVFLVDMNNMKICAANSKFLVLQNDGNVSIQDSSLLLLDVQTGVTWQLEHEGKYFYDKEVKDEFKVVVNNDILAIQYLLLSEERLVKVWRLDTKTLIYEEKYSECYNIVVETFTSLPVLVVLGNEVEVIKFSEDNTNIKLRSSTESLSYKYGSLNYPYVLVKEAEVNPPITSMCVLKIDWENSTLKTISSCSNIDMFAKDSQGEIAVEDIDNSEFMHNFYFTTCEKEVLVDDESEGSWLSIDLCVRILDVDGLITKEFIWPQYTCHDELYCDMKIIGSNLFLRIDRDLYVYKEEAGKFWTEDTEWIDFQKIEDLEGDIILYDKYDLKTAKITNNNTHCEIYVKKLKYF